MDKIPSGCPIYYFEPIEEIDESLLIELKQYFPDNKIIKCEHCYFELLHESDGSFINDLWRENTKLVAEYVKAVFEPMSLLVELEPLWDKQTLLGYVDRTLADANYWDLLRIHLAALQVKTSGSAIVPDLWVESSPLKVDLCEYAKNHGVNLKAYSSRASKEQNKELIAWTKRGRQRWVRTLTKKPWRILDHLAPAVNASKYLNLAHKKISGTEQASKVGVNFRFRSVSFDPAERSEFFWVPGSDVKWDDIILYNFRSHNKTAAQESVKQCSDRGVRVFGWGENIPKWELPDYEVEVRSILEYALGIITKPYLEKENPYTVEALYFLKGFAEKFAYWFVFFADNHIRLNVAPHRTCGIPQVAALKAQGGISLAYQFSISDMFAEYQMDLLSAGEDIHYVYSPYVGNRVRFLDENNELAVAGGFLYDYTLKSKTITDKYTDLKDQFRNAGAKIILCFFDENSIDHWKSVAPHDSARDDYRELFEWVLHDDELAVLIKPKVGSNLYERIKPLDELRERAQNTGRCLILGDEHELSSIFPSQAAVLADVCVSLLIGSTAAMEAALSGKPSCLLDRHNFMDHPLREIDKTDHLIFESWNDLQVQIDKVKNGELEPSDLGNWKDVMEDLDPFRDGKSVERFGACVAATREFLGAGETGERLLSLLKEDFETKWGVENVRYRKPGLGYLQI
ncbi:MAG: hypothetical protein AAF649_02955 [Verrucomicrobiota bacterium]